MLDSILLRDNGRILMSLMDAFNEMRCQVVELEDGTVIGVHATSSFTVLETQGYFFVGKWKEHRDVSLISR